MMSETQSSSGSDSDSDHSTRRNSLRQSTRKTYQLRVNKPAVDRFQPGQLPYLILKNFTSFVSVWLTCFVLQSRCDVLLVRFRKHCVILSCVILGAEQTAALLLIIRHLAVMKDKLDLTTKRATHGKSIVILFCIFFFRNCFIHFLSHSRHHPKDAAKIAGHHLTHSKDGKPATLADIDPMALDTSIRFQAVGGWVIYGCDFSWFDWLLSTNLISIYLSFQQAGGTY